MSTEVSGSYISTDASTHSSARSDQECERCLNVPSPPWGLDSGWFVVTTPSKVKKNTYRSLPWSGICVVGLASKASVSLRAAVSSAGGMGEGEKKTVAIECYPCTSHLWSSTRPSKGKLAENLKPSNICPAQNGEPVQMRQHMSSDM